LPAINKKNTTIFVCLFSFFGLKQKTLIVVSSAVVAGVVDFCSWVYNLLI
jgi:hypothetical protein